MAAHNELGKWGEDYAVKYLIQKGYVIRDRDWHLGKKDLDIVCQTEDGITLVFVEVKTRRSEEIADPVQAVDIKKMRNLGWCANMYIKENNIDKEIRFDIITIVANVEEELIKINHIEDAFNPCLL